MAKETMGEFMARRGFLTYEQVHEIIKLQQHSPNKLFGQIAVELGYIDDTLISVYFRERIKY